MTQQGFPGIAIRQPYVDLILAGIKDVENRSLRWSFRGWILVHASLKVEKEAVLRFRRDLGLEDPSDYDPVTGAILGMARIDDCVERMQSRFFTGPYGYVIGKVRRFRKPIPFKGSLGIFDVPLSRIRGTSAARVTPGAFDRG